MKKRTLLQYVVLQSRIWTYKMLYKTLITANILIEKYLLYLSDGDYLIGKYLWSSHVFTLCTFGLIYPIFLLLNS